MPPEVQQPAADPVAKLFGDGSNSTHPELMDQEQRMKESDRKPATERPAQAAPVQAEEPQTEATGEEKPPAPAKADTQAGDDKSTGEAEGDEPSIPDELTRLKAKYSGKPIEVAVGAILGLQRRENRTAEENKSLNERLEKALAFLTEHADEGPDGAYSLRADAAARALAQRRGGNGQADLAAAPTEAEIRAEVEQQEREYLAGILDEQYVDQTMKQPVTQAKIDRAVKAQLEKAQGEYAQTQHRVSLAIGQAVHEHLQSHPEDKELFGEKGEINKLYNSIPEDVRPRAILENWLGGLGKVAFWSRMERAFPQEMDRAFKMGWKARGQHQETQDAGAPASAGPRSNRSSRGSDDDYARDYKARILGADKMPGLGSIRR